MESLLYRSPSQSSDGYGNFTKTFELLLIHFNTLTSHLMSITSYFNARSCSGNADNISNNVDNIEGIRIKSVTSTTGLHLIIVSKPTHVLQMLFLLYLI